MCSKVDKSKVKKYVKCKMNCVLKFMIIFSKRILRLTLYEIFWICVVFFTAFFIWTLKCKVEEKLVINNETPTIVWWTSGFPSTSETRYCENNIKCDIVSNGKDSNVSDAEAFLFYASNIDFHDLPLPRKPLETIWGIYHEESPRNVEELMHEKILNLFNYSATFSRHSDVPFTLQYLESLNDITDTKYYIPTAAKNSLLEEISPIIYLQTDCETATERDIYVKELMKFIKIDSYGACLNNKKMPKEFTEDYLNNLNDDNFLKFIARYKFVIAIENGVCEDYVTEKFWRAIKVGSVPIYFGSPTIKDWFPNNKSAILLADYRTPKLMSDYIKTLLGDDRLYEEFLSHKTKEEITNKRLLHEISTNEYQTDALEVARKFECLVCNKLYDKKMGKLETRIVDKRHYNCPKPISALTLKVNPSNDWVYSWQIAYDRADDIYRKIIGSK